MYLQFFICIGVILGFSRGDLVPPCPGLNCIACADRSKGIPWSAICDYNRDCEDYSDEFSLPLCKAISSSKKSQNCATANEIYCPNSPLGYRQPCVDIRSICFLGGNCLAGTNLIICDVITSGILPSPPEIGKINSETETFIAMAKSVLNDALRNESRPCPPFYQQFNSICLAPFSPIKLPWTRAREFCQDMKGSLVIMNESYKLFELLEFLKTNGVPSKFWLGGSYANVCSSQSKSSSDGPSRSISASQKELKMIYEFLRATNISSNLLFRGSNSAAVLSPSKPTSNATENQNATATDCMKWVWLDGEPVKLGSPFWSVVYSSTQPHSSKCPILKKQQAPILSASEGKCLALLDDNFYLFSDELCTETLSPLCMTDQTTLS